MAFLIEFCMFAFTFFARSLFISTFFGYDSYELPLLLLLGLTGLEKGNKEWAVVIVQLFSKDM